MRRDPVGVLHGLPVAHKDLVDTAGIRTTLGSPFYRDNVPSRDALLVTRMRAAGAITVGKTNTPEFGAGSQTFNAVFGATRNPYDTTKTCGGSSGGAATAVAARMLPIADGSDAGGSLRNPPAFCNVVGLRPSPGRVPNESTSWGPFAVAGPIARTVADVALFLSAIAGPDARSPLSIQEDPARFRSPLEKDFKGVRVAWWQGLGGIPFEPEIRRVVDANRKIFQDLGCVVEEAEPDFSGVAEAFPLLRFVGNHPRYAPLVRQRPEWVKDTIKFEVAEAERASGADVGRAQARQALMYDQSRQFFERYQYFILPVTQVEPFDVNTPYPTAIGRYGDEDLYRLDARVLVRHDDGQPGDLGPGWILRERAAGRLADRRASPGRVERLAARARLRARHAPWRAPAIVARLASSGADVDQTAGAATTAPTSGSALISFEASTLNQSSAPRSSRLAIGTNGAS